MFRRLINFSLATMFVLFGFGLVANAQDQTETAPAELTSNREDNVGKPATQVESVPVYRNFMGVGVGMSTDEAREKLGNPKDKSKQQDFFVFSDSMTAQVYYDDGKVVAISVDYMGKNSKAPAPEDVVGQVVQARPDGSLYALERYPDAGFWVAYSRTSGESPITTVTLQKL